MPEYSHRRALAGVITMMVLAILACGPAQQAPVTPDSPTVEPPTSTPTEAPVTGVPPAAPTAEPTGEQPGDEAPSVPEGCPQPTFLALPAEVPVFADYHVVIGEFLSQGGTPESLRDGLRNWGSISDEAGAVIDDADLTGDGIPEVIVLVQAPQSQFPDVFLLPGDLYVYQCDGGAYRLLYADFSEVGNSTPQIDAVDDLNANGADNIVYEVSYCGAHTCFVEIFALGYDATSDMLVDLLPNEGKDTPYEGSSVPYPEVIVADLEGDGLSEIVVDIGGIGSAGAGPQRTYRNTFAWTGVNFEMVNQEITSPEVWPIHLIMDADAASELGAFSEAIDLYRQMLDLADPPTWSRGEEEITLLGRYARYRMMVMFALLGDLQNAEAINQELSGESSGQADPVQDGFIIMANRFWDAFSAAGDIGAACQEVITYAEATPDSYQILNDFGYANSFYEPVDLCPFGQ